MRKGCVQPGIAADALRAQLNAALGLQVGLVMRNRSSFIHRRRKQQACTLLCLSSALLLSAAVTLADEKDEPRMIRHQQFNSTYKIRVGESQGTAFYMPLEKKHFLVTAKHLWGKSEDSQAEILLDEEWVTLPGAVTPHADSRIDIAAIEVDPGEVGTPQAGNTKFGSTNLIISAEVFFLGYPYGLGSETTLMRWPSAMVKGAIVAGSAETNDGFHLGFYLDGHNNPGFSGGPCVWQRNDGVAQVFGVVSSYLPQRETLYDKDGKARMVLFENSGLFQCHDLSHMITLLRDRSEGSQ